jgi:hypothetical protein
MAVSVERHNKGDEKEGFTMKFINKAIGGEGEVGEWGTESPGRARLTRTENNQWKNRRIRSML